MPPATPRGRTPRTAKQVETEFRWFPDRLPASPRADAEDDGLPPPRERRRRVGCAEYSDRYPAGGGYRILRRPLTDTED
jgi:hypothetical protein